MNETAFAEILARGYELRNVEYKGPGHREVKPFLARVARAVIGMANLRDGGLVTIGVAEKDDQPDVVGLDADQLASWAKFDNVAATIGEFVQPSVTFDLEVLHFHGVPLALLHVREFDDLPILCAKDAHDEKQQPIVRRGACYVRSKRRRETAEVPTQEEMRELLDLAIEKGVRRFIALAQGTGFEAGAIDASARYDEELKELR